MTRELEMVPLYSPLSLLTRNGCKVSDGPPLTLNCSRPPVLTTLSSCGISEVRKWPCLTCWVTRTRSCVSTGRITGTSCREVRTTRSGYSKPNISPSQQGMPRKVL
uniref:Uncharacterized protein n=1 Tax=Cacopsylla melanoneura TaxID=428564 RepID=A0A8D8S564_9HEMI